MNELIEKRRSIRKFKSAKPVTEEQLKKLMHAAMMAPSACNTRPWEFIAITNRKIMDEIINFHPYTKMLKTASAAIVVVALPQTGLPEGFFPQDCGAAVQNILLEAVSLGLGTCWCGIYPKKEMVNSLQKLLDIPQPKLPFCVIAVGVPDESPEPRGFYDESKVRFVE